HHDLGGNGRHHEQNAQREDDQVVEISQDWNEIRNEVDRRKRIGRDRDRKDFCVPRHAAIVRGEVNRMTIPLDPAGPGFDAGEHQGDLRGPALGNWSQEASGKGPTGCALWMAEGTKPKCFRKTRLKCDELEKPHENATSVIVLPLCVSSSWRQCSSLARQI